MAVILQVRDLRAAIYRATGNRQGDGLPSSPLLGRLFHELFATLVGPDPSRNFHAAIDDAEAEIDEWRRALVKHSYHNIIGPRLQRNRALLHHLTDQTLVFWDAAQELCGWLAEIFWQLRLSGDEEFALADSLRVEQPLLWKLQEPDWNDAVQLTGIADAVWRIPAAEQWCVIELKTGRTSPESDLAQACLYHQMLASSGEKVHGALALVSFEPQRRERLFSTSDLSEAQLRLKRLIGKIAGVAPETAKSEPVLSSQSPATNGAAGIGVVRPEHTRLGEMLVNTLKEYGAEVTIDGDPVAGPAFLRFPVRLGERVRLRTVDQLSKEIQVRLKLDAPPRIAAEGGRVTIDLQRRDRQTVLFSQIRPQLPEPHPLLGSSQIPVGVDIDGKLKLIDLTQPEDSHLLVAGTTGSGKSEWLRAMIAGLTANNTPATLQLLLIDPKRNAFHQLRNSPFLYCPIVFPDEQPAAEALADLVDEMEFRYRLFSEMGDDSLSNFVMRTGRQMPRIICACDEYADLIGADRQTRRAIEQQITRLGQKARAAGIHLVIATQQPSREIIKGVLDSNIPARVGLKMQKAIESKMLLNYAGAERLLGRGDLLFRDIGEPVRLQGIYLPPS